MDHKVVFWLLTQLQRGFDSLRLELSDEDTVGFDVP